MDHRRRPSETGSEEVARQNDVIQQMQHEGRSEDTHTQTDFHQVQLQIRRKIRDAREAGDTHRFARTAILYEFKGHDAPNPEDEEQFNAYIKCYVTCLTHDNPNLGKQISEGLAKIGQERMSKMFNLDASQNKRPDQDLYKLEQRRITMEFNQKRQKFLDQIEQKEYDNRIMEMQSDINLLETGEL